MSNFTFDQRDKPPAPERSRLLNRKQAARYLGVSERTIFTLFRERGLATVQIGPRCIKFDRNDLDAFIERCKKGDGSPIESEVSDDSR